MAITSKRIDSKNNKTIKDALSLKDGNSDLFLIEGYHMIEMALEHSCLKCIFSLKEYLHPSDVDFYLVNEDIIKKLSESKNPEGIVGIASKPSKEIPSSGKAIYLERVQDPGNVGTILRTALAFGYKDVYLSKGSASPYKYKALMSSQGAIFALNIREGDVNTLKKLKEKGVEVLATSLHNAVDIESYKPKKDFVLLLGNEGQGLSDEAISVSDKSLKIDMSGIDSLNVAVAGAIAMYILSK